MYINYLEKEIGKYGFLCFFFCIPNIFLCAQVPAWYADKESQYPSSRYIAAVGEGATRALAETAALTAVSLFFNTSTNIRNHAIREFNEAVANNTTDFTQKTYIDYSGLIRPKVPITFGQGFR